MNTKRLIIAIIVGFIFIFGSDFVIHGLWMRPDYAASASMWRPDAEMQSRFGLMLAAHLLLAVTFVVLYAKGFAGMAGLRCACMFGLFMGLFNQVNTLIMYVVSPLPPQIAVKWFLSGLVQTVLLGIITFFVYKPAQPAVLPVK